jgi:hypothetical protein
MVISRATSVPNRPLPTADVTRLSSEVTSPSFGGRVDGHLIFPNRL